MSNKIALKRLTKSDLTIFECHFRNPNNKSKQKSLNLNSDVFVDQLYPRAAGRVPQKGAPMPSTLYGPGVNKGYKVKSTITPRNEVDLKKQKNWRFGGPLIRDPEDTPNRFHVLEPGDLVIMGFDGDLAPEKANLLFVAHGHPDDGYLHAALDELIPGGKKTMVQLTSGDLEAVAASISLRKGHPFPDVILEGSEEDLQDALFGSVSAVQRATRGGRRSVSATELEQAHTNAQRIGQDGELLVNAHLIALVAEGILIEAVWIADANAAAPLDFRVTMPGGYKTFIDAKSTTGPFNRDFHISAAEVAYAAASDVPYIIYRVFELSDEGAHLRVSDDIRRSAQNLMKALDRLPAGYKPDSFSVDPNTLTWSDEVQLTRSEE